MNISRREVIRIGSLATLGLSLPDLIRPAVGADSGGHRRPAKACVLVWLDGGPSHIDTFDPKPDAPSEVRGPFAAIPTSLVGVRISELLPRMAERLDRCTLIRSVTSPLGEHNLGAQYLMTGYPPSSVIDYPPIVSVMAQARDAARSTALPASVAVPDFRIGGGGISSHGFLPPQFAPFSVGSDPSRHDFEVRNLAPPSGLSPERLARREAHRRWLDGPGLEDRGLPLPLAGEGSGEGGKTDPLTQQAFEMLRSPRTRGAFDLRAEADSVRRRYGMKTIGQSCLLARRLLESGVPLVSVIDHGWDTHADVVTRLRDGFTGAATPVGLAPSLDMALSALIDDLEERGMFDETLIVVMGEFGRTPKWNVSGGRDHWPRVFSVLLAGGPIKRGMVFGASDRHGESPMESAVTPADLAHTIYHAMGVDPATVFHTPDGRPIRLADEAAHVIADVLT